jgi:DNA-binding NarL/FixJ family response regulator
MRGHTPHPRLAETRADPQQLTRRQRDVLEQLTAGHSNEEIATNLGISPKTVNSHITAIFTKLGVHNRTQAAAYIPNSRTNE